MASVRFTVCAAIVLALASPAHAQKNTGLAEPAKVKSEFAELSWSYLYDGGVIPFVYATISLRLGIDLWAPTRTPPLFFDQGDGGAPSHKSQEVPTWTIQAGALGLGIGLALIRDESRWFHVKGFLESLSTTVALTAAAKHGFGRIRPDTVVGEPIPNDQRLSFFSGHSSAALSALTYTALYLRYHGFDEARGQSLLTGWEAFTYAGLLGLAIGVPASRFVRNRHHLSDVVVGSAVGAGLSAAFFYWQEARYRDAVSGAKRSSLRLLPNLEDPGLSLAMTW
ncbi:MAG: phosphatase PAP2 family protein [Kofleriaceae bacterium]|nr:phosphatase PAP2 family protein [Kofleriaceae bacterium]